MEKVKANPFLFLGLVCAVGLVLALPLSLVAPTECLTSWVAITMIGAAAFGFFGFIIWASD